jgi:LAS superfamily LD-carboxypeptidase LdcB
MNNFIELLKPQNIFTPKKRFGPAEDGGYVLPEFVFNKCSALFSYGIGRDSRFEVDFGETYKKPAYLFDHTIRQHTPGWEEYEKNEWKNLEEYWEKSDCHFIPTGLGYQSQCNDFINDYQKLNINGYVILKIDIEGGEYDYFLKTDIEKISSMAIAISLEVHYINVEKNRDDLVNILEKLKKYFILCHVHGNNWSNLWKYEEYSIPETLELSFVNKKFIDKFEPDEQSFPINGLDVPNRPDKEDYKLSFLNRNRQKLLMSIGDIVDRYSICKLKSERQELDNTKEINALLNEIERYDGINEYINKLYEINGKCWDLEADIRNGNEEILGLEEIGRRALKLRDLNKIRVSIKNDVNSHYNQGFIEVKSNHGSEKTPSLIISLTTVPERLNESHDTAIMSTIKSLCEQDDEDYEIHFNIPEIYNITQEPYIIPDWLHSFVLKYPHLRIFRTKDFGPPTKLVPTLNRIKNPETILLVVDDDLVYHKDMIKEHRKYQDMLKDCAICYDGREAVDNTKFGDLRDAWIACVTEIREVYIMQHYKSVSYKRKLFNQDFFDRFLGKTLSDDVLISRFLNAYKVKIFVVPYEPENHLFETLESWTKNLGVTTFPVLRHTGSNAANSGCNHPGLLALPNGKRFFEPNNFDKI